MAGAVPTFATAARVERPDRATAEPWLLRAVLIVIVFVFFALFLFLPLVVVFQEAFARGLPVFLSAFKDSAALSAIKLTLLAAGIAVPLNTLFGIVAAWSLTRFDFPGRPILITLIDLPLWISPVVGGLIYVLVFGAQGWLGPWLTDPFVSIPWWTTQTGWFWKTLWHSADSIKIIFAVPGIALATIFVTFPFVARGLIPLMQAQGTKEEEAALSLGANGWQIFWRVTLPKIKWGLIYGIILCNARAMGEFGAVSVVSGHIRGRTNTIPLHIEILYQEYQFAAAFAVASLLCILALLTLAIKTYAEWRAEQQLAEAARMPEFSVKR